MIERINVPKMNACVAAMWLGIAILNGAVALENNNDAIRADAQAEVYDTLGMPTEAQPLRVEADSSEDDRNNKLLLVGLNLGAAAGFAGVAAIGSASRRRYGQ